VIGDGNGVRRGGGEVKKLQSHGVSSSNCSGGVGYSRMNADNDSNELKSTQSDNQPAAASSILCWSLH